MIEDLIFEKWKDVQLEVNKEMQEEISSLQKSIKNIKNPKNAVETYLHIKYHNKDSCMGCYYAEDDYDIVIELPVTHPRFEDMLIFSEINNNDNDCLEKEIRFKKSLYMKKVNVSDEEYNDWYKQVSKRIKSILNWKREYYRCKNIIASDKGDIKRLEVTVSKSIYSESYILEKKQKIVELKKEVKKAKNNTYYNNYTELMKLTNSFSEEIY